MVSHPTLMFTHNVHARTYTYMLEHITHPHTHTCTCTQDGRLQKGDRILAVNGETFTNLTRERALTILTQFKLR